MSTIIYLWGGFDKSSRTFCLHVRSKNIFKNGYVVWVRPMHMELYFAMNFKKLKHILFL